MDADLPVRLRLLIPAVENAVAGDAMRPLDVITTRKGITVEVGNTDAVLDGDLDRFIRARLLQKAKGGARPAEDA